MGNISLPDPKEIILMSDITRRTIPAASDDVAEAVGRVVSLRLLEGKADIEGAAKLMRMVRELSHEMINPLISKNASLLF